MKGELQLIIYLLVFCASCAGDHIPRDSRQLSIESIYIWDYDSLLADEQKREMIDSIKTYLYFAERMDCNWNNYRKNTTAIAIDLTLENGEIIDLHIYENSEFGHYVGYCLVDYFCPKLNRYFINTLNLDTNNPVNEKPCEISANQK